jgi:hypothetical protein
MSLLKNLQRCFTTICPGLRSAGPGSRRPARLGLEALEDRAVPANLGLLVPAYFYPSPGGADWAQLTQAASQVPITAIMNPNSGPGTAYDPNYATAVNQLRDAGGQVLGYVPTGYGKVPLKTVETEIKEYHNWYHIDGIFLDEMAAPGATAAQTRAIISYYSKLDSFIHNLQPSWNDVGNPGVNVPASYINQQAADELVTFENNTPYSSYQPPAWVKNYPASDSANIVENVPTVAGMQAVVNQAVNNHVGALYVTDATGNPGTNPYGALPSYWSQLVAAVAAVDANN